ncbi:hypothetical protein U1769_09700 [Sphingomonas sp. ZT3P38]|uniref:hypothetical protein n=1 Tax=Parasphingomonas zepuensis TaxID=3096161 RepID=UPI002FC99CCA
MRSWRALISALILFQMTGPASFAIVAVPPQVVGPPSYMASADCPAQFARPGGTTMGAAIPVPALRLGAPAQRATVSFGTGGGGTSNAIELARRRRLGLPTEPKTFDLAGSALPMVYAPEGTLFASGFYAYQRLPLTTKSKNYWPNGLIYALPASSNCFAGSYAFNQACRQGKAPDDTCLENVGRCLPAATEHRCIRIRHVRRTAAQTVFANWMQLAPARLVQPQRMATRAGLVRPANGQRCWLRA